MLMLTSDGWSGSAMHGPLLERAYQPSGERTQQAKRRTGLRKDREVEFKSHGLLVVFLVLLMEIQQISHEEVTCYHL